MNSPSFADAVDGLDRELSLVAFDSVSSLIQTINSGLSDFVIIASFSFYSMACHRANLQVRIFQVRQLCSQSTLDRIPPLDSLRDKNRLVGNTYKYRRTVLFFFHTALTFFLVCLDFQQVPQKSREKQTVGRIARDG
jgi:hypothetical protein